MNNKTLDIYGIGNAITDRIYSVDDQTLKQLGIEKAQMSLINSQDIQRLSKNLEVKQSLAAGSVANALFSSVNFSARCSFSGKVGQDALGKAYIKQLNQALIKTPFQTQQDSETGQCLVYITPDAERSMATFLGVSATFGPSDICQDALTSSKWLLIEGYLLFTDSGFEAVKHAINLAKTSETKCALSVADPAVASVCLNKINSLLELGLDLLACNTDEAAILTGQSNPELQLQALAKKVGLVVLTAGAKGAWVAENTEHYFCASEPVKATDTVGAGDAFIGTFLAVYILEKHINKALKAAHKQAGHIVQVSGARPTQQHANSLHS